MFCIHKNSRRSAVLQKFEDLVVVQSGIERDRNAARRNDAKVCGHPSRVIVSQDGETRSGRKVVFGDPTADRLRPTVKLTVSAAFNVIMTLELKRDVVGPALGTLQETIEERGHGSWGILQEK